MLASTPLPLPLPSEQGPGEQLTRIRVYLLSGDESAAGGRSATCFNDSLSPSSSFSTWRARREQKFAPRAISRFCFRSGESEAPPRPLESEEDMKELRDCYSKGLVRHSKATTFRIAVIAERAAVDSRPRLGVQTRRQRTTSDLNATAAPTSRAREPGSTPTSKKPRGQQRIQSTPCLTPSPVTKGTPSTRSHPDSGYWETVLRSIAKTIDKHQGWSRYA